MFIQRSVSVPGDLTRPDLELHKIAYSDLAVLASPVHQNVTRFLTPKLVKLVEDLCASNLDAYNQLLNDEDNAFWGVFIDGRLVAITGLFSIEKEKGREVSSRGFCGVFDPNNFGLGIASRTMPVRSWHGFIERKLDFISSYVAAENARSLKAVAKTGYMIIGTANVPGTSINGMKLCQYNPALGYDAIYKLAVQEADKLGQQINPQQVRDAYNITVSQLDFVGTEIIGEN